MRTDVGLRGSISGRVRSNIQISTVYFGILVFDVSDDKVDLDSFNLSEVLQVGMRIDAVVIAVKKDRLQLELSIKVRFLFNSLKKIHSINIVEFASPRF